MTCRHNVRPIANARLAGVLLWGLILLMLAGCATGPRLAGPATRDLPPRVQLEAVPFHAQRDYQEQLKDALDAANNNSNWL